MSRGRRALLISTYELGRQPFGLASPAAWLRARGWEVTCADLAREPLPEDVAACAALVGFHLQMHTATRLAAPVIARVRALNPSARVCAYGLYAPLNADWLRTAGVDDVFGGEFEADVAAAADAVNRSTGTGGPPAPDSPLPRLRFLVPDRSTLPPLDRYAALTLPDGRQRVVGSTEASRGCRHLCRHCPVVPVYDGQFRIVQADVVLADIENQIAAGAEHITFGDPDFFNGPTHALRIVEALHASHPRVSYDVTIKIEHLLRHRALLPRLRETGCLFVTSAVESLDDRVLALLDKGHTRADFLEAVGLCREAGVTLAPTFVAFHPWMTLDGYCELLDALATLGLVERIPPVQLSIRLLVPKGSRLLALPEVTARLGPFDPQTLTYRWAHEDPRVDALHLEVARVAAARSCCARSAAFSEIHRLAYVRAGRAGAPPPAVDADGPVARLNEPWYCCAEPI
jgi:radical SAM superfamily enzyme YgiQ (UPF0313 family)